MAELTYTRVGDYELPNVVPPESPQVGPFGRAYLMKGKLKEHVELIDRDAEELFDAVVRAEAKTRGVTEALKARDQMEWVRQMNAVRAAVREYVMVEVLTL